MRKQFDLKYYLEHPETKLVTRDERDARILCTDLKNSTYPIVAACDSKCNDMEIIVALTNEGKTCTNSIQENPTDLFFDLPDPEKKKVPLTIDDMVERIKSGKTMWLINDRGIVFNIIDFDFDNVYYIYGGSKEIIPDSYEEVMKGTTFVNGDPTWKEVEE